MPREDEICTINLKYFRPPFMSEDIAKRLKLEVDTKEKHDLKGVATAPTKSLGTTRNVPVNFAPGCTIYSDFAVIKYPKPMLILPNTLLDKYNYDLLASKRQLRLECDGKELKERTKRFVKRINLKNHSSPNFHASKLRYSPTNGKKGTVSNSLLK